MSLKQFAVNSAGQQFVSASVQGAAKYVSSSLMDNDAYHVALLGRLCCRGVVYKCLDLLTYYVYWESIVILWCLCHVKTVLPVRRIVLKRSSERLGSSVEVTAHGSQGLSVSRLVVCWRERLKRLNKS